MGDFKVEIDVQKMWSNRSSSKDMEPEMESDADRDATPPPRKKSKVEASIATTSPKTPTKQGTQLDTPTSPMTRQMAATIVIASTPPSASTRSKVAAPSPLRRV